MNLAGQRIGVYARHSTERQNPRSSEDQIARCIAWAAAHGGVVSPALVYRDDALTGQTTARPGLQSILRAADEGRLDIILVEDLTRVSRDAEDAHGIRKRLRFADVRLVSVADGLDTGQSSSSLLFGVQAAMGEEYLRQLADKTRRGLVGRIQSGALTGAPPYGYDSAPAANGIGRVPVISPDKARIVQRIFAERAAGRSYGEIADGLNRDGVAPPRGKREDTRKRRGGWALSGIRSMLRNERYVGVWTFGEGRWIRHPGTGKRVRRPGLDVVRIEIPESRIVDEETWARVAEIGSRTAAEHRRDGGAVHGRRVYPLSTLVRCSVCDGPMVIVGSARPAYRCDHSRGNGGLCDNRQLVREADLREAILGEVRGYFGRPEVAEALLEIAREELRAFRSTAADDTDAGERELAATEQKIARLVDVVADGSAPKSVIDRLRELEDAAGRQRARLTSLRSVARLEPRLPSAAEIVERVRSLGEVVDAAPSDARRAFAALFPDGIRLTPMPEGAYRADWELDGGALVFATKTESKTPPGVSRGGALCTSTARYAVGCGDPLGTAYRSKIPGFVVVRRAG